MSVRAPAWLWAGLVFGMAAVAAAADPAPPHNAPAKPAAPVANPAGSSPADVDGLQTRPDDAFGVPVTLAAQPMLYVKGSGTWNKAFAIIGKSLQKVEGYMDRAGLKAGGMPMTIFTATDENGFDYLAAVPLAEAPQKPPHGEISFGHSPEGQALQFVHRGTYEAMDNTYEAITNYLDDKRIEAKDLVIEQYVTDPAAVKDKNLIVNVFIFPK